MRKATNKDLVVLIAAVAPLTILEVLSGLQVTNYLQATTKLGLHAFAEPRWYFGSILMALYGSIGFVAIIVVKRCIETLLKRYGGLNTRCRRHIAELSQALRLLGT